MISRPSIPIGGVGKKGSRMDQSEPLQSFIDLGLSSRWIDLLAAGRGADVCEIEAANDTELLARGWARMQAGREIEARADYRRARRGQPLLAEVEMALLDVKERNFADADQRLSAVMPSVAKDPIKSAHARHYRGVALSKLKRHDEALADLAEASAIYRREGRRRCAAEVDDSIGAAHDAKGSTDDALAYFTLSIAEKSIVGDRRGLALTLASMGRALVRVGRIETAIECFARTKRLATEIDDLRTAATAALDIGAAHLASVPPDIERAVESFGVAAATAQDPRRAFVDVQFSAFIGEAQALLAQTKIADAKKRIVRAEMLLPLLADPSFVRELRAERAFILLAEGNAREALEILESAIREFDAVGDAEESTRCRIAAAEAAESLRWQDDAVRHTRAALKAVRESNLRRLSPVVEKLASRVLGASLGDDQGIARAEVAGCTLLKKIGSGRDGTIWRAWQSKSDRLVALKVVGIKAGCDPAKAEKSLTSALAILAELSNLRHRSIARILESGRTADNGIFLVRELVDGRSLRERFDEAAGARAGIFSDIEVTIAVAQLADALFNLHQKGVAHGDIKPENIVFRPGGEPVLVDLALADMINGVDPTDAFGRRRRYHAPEAMTVPTPAGDVWALGAVFFEWLTGTAPPDDAGSFSNDIVGLMTAARPDLTADLVELVERMMCIAPARRLDSALVAAVCQEAARRIASGTSAPSSVRVPIPRPKPSALPKTLESKVIDVSAPTPPRKIVAPVPPPASKSPKTPDRPVDRPAVEQPKPDQRPAAAPPPSPVPAAAAAKSSTPDSASSDAKSGPPSIFADPKKLKTMTLHRSELGKLVEVGKFMASLAMPRIVFIESDMVREVPLTGHLSNIGRGPVGGAVAVSIRDASVSRVHAQFDQFDGATRLTDLESSNGTFVNGEKLAAHKKTILDEECRITFGTVDCLFFHPNAVASSRLQRKIYLRALSILARKERGGGLGEARRRGGAKATKDTKLRFTERRASNPCLNHRQILPALREAETSRSSPGIRLVRGRHVTIEEWIDALQMAREDLKTFVDPYIVIDEPRPTKPLLLPDPAVSPKRIEIQKRPVTFGAKGTSNDFKEFAAIVHPSIGDSHAEIVVKDGVGTIVDLGQPSGTFVDGRRLAPKSPEPLPDECVIRIGDVEVLYSDRDYVFIPSARRRLYERALNRLVDRGVIDKKSVADLLQKAIADRISPGFLVVEGRRIKASAWIDVLAAVRGDSISQRL